MKLQVQIIPREIPHKTMKVFFLKKITVAMAMAAANPPKKQQQQLAMSKVLKILKNSFMILLDMYSRLFV